MCFEMSHFISMRWYRALLAISYVFASQVLFTISSSVQAEPHQIQFFESWRVSCPQDTADSCRVWQRVQVHHDGTAQDVMAVSIAPADQGLVLLVQVPLDIYLPADFGLRVDGQGERRLRYRNCNQTGCWVAAPADAQLLRQFRRGITAEAALSLVEGETVRISFSLLGFTAAMVAFEEIRDRFE